MGRLFLDYLREHGIDGKGIELNNYCIDFAKSNGIDVDNSSLKSQKDNDFTIITMFDVLEHLENPVNFFKDANVKLKSGGYILAYAPNIHSISSILMGGKHNMLAIFNHLCFLIKNRLNFWLKIQDLN